MRNASFALGCLVASSMAQALDFHKDGVAITVHAAAVYGTGWRISDRDPQLIYSGNGAVIGATATGAGGRNQDDGNLNFSKGDIYSSVLKFVGSVELKKDNLGFMLRAKAWTDFALEDENRPWGNSVQGFGAGRPLSDSGFSSRAQFSGTSLQEAYLFGLFDAGRDSKVTLRVGRQFVPWGMGWSVPGGLSMINAVDLPAIHRPGALPEEMGVPAPMLFAKYDMGTKLSLNGFVQFGFEPMAQDGCGTFFSRYDYVAEGCQKVFLGGTNDATATSTGLYLTRNATPKLPDGGQYGLGLTYKAQELRTEFGGYLARYHSRVPYVVGIKTSRPGAVPFLPGDADGLNPHYFIEYPEGVRMLGLTIKSDWDSLSLAGELVYRPNQPVTLNATDMLNAIGSNTAPTLLRADATATPYGGAYRGYDLRKITNLQLAATRKWRNLLAADLFSFGGELVVKYVNDLPDVNSRRYGRLDTFGIGPVAGSCTGSSLQCTNDGYVSKSAWGYRLKVYAFYPEIASTTDLHVNATFGHDVKGWSYDNMLIAGSRFADVSMKAIYQKIYFAELTARKYWGGDYSQNRDRSYLTAAVGIRF